MQLQVLERLMLLNILPTEGSYTTLKIVRKLREDLSFSEEEHALLKFNQEGDSRLTWDNDADTGAEIAIGPKATEVIVKRLKELDKKEKLTMQQMRLFELFVPADED